MIAIHLEKVSLSDMQNIRIVFNTLTADDKYYLFNRGNLLQNFQMPLSQKQTTSSQIFLPFGNLDSILNIFQKMMTLIADVFLNLQPPKNGVR